MSGDRRPLILFFGSIRAGEHETLASAGREVGLIRDVESPYARHVPAGLAVLEEIPFSAGLDKLCACIEEKRQSWDVTCLPVLFEGHIELAAEVARRLGYPAHDDQTLLAVRNKTVMRDRLAYALGADCTGRYAGVTCLDEALRFGDEVGYPVVLKPARLYNSLHVHLCVDRQSLRAAFVKMTARLLEHRDAVCAGVALVQAEEYLRGSDHSVDVIAAQGMRWPTAVIDVITGDDLGAPDFHHFARLSPSLRSADEQQALQDLAVRVTEAVGIRTGAAHVEMIWTDRGPRVLEVGARPGGNRHYLLYEGRGIDLIGGYVAALSGAVPGLTPVRNRQVAVVTVSPATSGRLRRYRHLNLIEELPSFAALLMRAKQGDYVGSPLDGIPPPLMVQLAAADAATLRGDCQRLWDLRESVFEVTDDG